MSYRLFSFFSLKRIFLCFLMAVDLVLFNPCLVNAELQVTKGEDGSLYSRSLESLKDLDSRTWQVVAYRKENLQETLILRIVGYPGTLRLDHPLSLQVHSGRRDWELKDVTLSNSDLLRDSRAAAAEFELQPLLMDLDNNRPLRLMLRDVFTELPIPPYLVGEWRSLLVVEPY